jgi:hypothetical protein
MVQMSKNTVIAFNKDLDCPHCKGEGNHSRNKRDQCKNEKANSKATKPKKKNKKK